MDKNPTAKPATTAITVPRVRSKARFKAVPVSGDGINVTLPADRNIHTVWGHCCDAGCVIANSDVSVTAKHTRADKMKASVLMYLVYNELKHEEAVVEGGEPAVDEVDAAASSVLLVAISPPFF